MNFEEGRQSTERQIEATVDELSSEFDQRLDPEVLRHHVARSFDEFAGAPVRDFIPILARREARARLRSLVGDRAS
jgi:hypothetical protein